MVGVLTGAGERAGTWVDRLQRAGCGFRQARVTPSRSPLLHDRLKALPQISDLLAGADPKVLAKVRSVSFDVHSDTHSLTAPHPSS
jgi:hypothetical protein